MLDAVKANTKIGDKSYGVPFCWGTSAQLTWYSNTWPCFP